ncbi:hypothetical protein DPMN_102027 [Dreissena polymorpha]|uniref:Uncharacterized protein n=1 Tax=Dreissena polymorpha TaxID=45954 RepID=A0A9D4LK42_DREPO|nr:hypothetical protein DPMN_102027 [Dreissena polymorpha]
MVDLKLKLRFPLDVATTTHCSDVLLLSRGTKKLVLLELTRKKNETKYQPLFDECQQLTRMEDLSGSTCT